MLKVVHSVHPRSRGEISPATRCGSVCSGSPPLARGNLAEAGGGDPEGGFTPARAGKSGVSPICWWGSAVHPRSRGEILLVCVVWQVTAGSPPLARGNRFSSGPGRRFPRFTPARAGKSAQSRWPSRHTKVHPRSRGEIEVIQVVYDDVKGSPPLARGNPPASWLGAACFWFTPARAGKSINVPR